MRCCRRWNFRLLRKVLFEGGGGGAISSYVAGWMASHRIDVIVLDGANRFDPYAVSSFARKESISPESLLKRIRIARAFTCYQMATLMGEKLPIRQSAVAQAQKPWVILLGPITTFLDEDVPEREVRPLFERSLKKVEILAEEGVPFFLFQAMLPSRSKRAYLMKRLFQFAHLVLRINVDDEGPKVTLEKGPKEFQIRISKRIVKGGAGKGLNNVHRGVNKRVEAQCHVTSYLPNKGEAV